MIRIRSLLVLAALPASFLAALAGGVAVEAQQRCEGTLCDLYYNGSPPPPAATQPAGPTPMTVPSLPTGNVFSNFFSRSDNATPAATPAAPGTAQAAAAPAQGGSSGFFHVGGGGLAGGHSGECGGTICDLMHGHSSEDDSGASLTQSTNGVPISRYGNDAAPPRPVEPVAVPASTAGQAAAEPRVAVRVAPTPPVCAAKGGDPWSCYRR